MILSLLFSSIISFYLSFKSICFKYVFFLTYLSLFIITYVFIDNSFADDRAQYFYWFLNYDDFIASHHDFVLSYYFMVISFFLEDEKLFFLILSLSFLILLFSIAKSYLNSKEMMFFFALILFNRLYLDYDMNAIRSTFASLILLIMYLQIESKGNKYYLFLLPVVFFTHKSIFLVISLFFIISLFLRLKWAFYFFICSLILFLCDVNLVGSLTQKNELILYFKDININSYKFIFSGIYNTSYELKIQFFIYIALPTILLYFNEKENDRGLIFIISSVGIVLLLYKIVPVLSRSFAFFMPLIYLYLLKNKKTNDTFVFLYINFVFWLNTFVFIKNLDFLNIGI